ncbi:MAG: TonB-dependent receptor domain-containing protein [Terriglobia bacterium]
MENRRSTSNGDQDTFYQFTDVLNMVRGRHTIEVGAEVHQQLWNLYQDSQTDSFVFNKDYTGNSIANLLIGWPFSVEDAQGDPDGIFRSYTYALFVADNIQATSRLTLNLGLRDDYNQPSINTQGHQEVFDWQTGEYIRPGTDGITRGIVFPDYREWGPRVGLAWRPFGQKTSVRASYGIYWLVPDWNMDQQKILTPDNYPKYLYTGTAAAPPMSLDDAFPATTLASALIESGDTEYPYNRMPYAEQYGLTIEHQVSPNLLVEVAYDGSNSHHMVQRTAINPASPDPTGLIPLTQRVPYPLFSGGITANMEQGNATYNALTVSVNKRFSRGVSFMAGYTYSKSMDDGTPDSEVEFPYNIRLNHAPSTFNVPQRLVMSWVYQLPVGRGRHFMTNPSSRLVDSFLGGWQVSGIATFDDGIGLTPGTAYAVNMGGRIPIVPNRIGPVNDAALRGDIRGLPGGVVGPYFNTSDIAAQVGNVQGNAGRDFIIAPGINNWDLSLFKSLRLGEQKSLQIRSDFFNAFNHTQFLPPNVTIGSSSFGYISGAREARGIQFSLKFLF